MGFIKFVSPADYIKDEPLLDTVKVASRRPLGTDKKAFEKRAGRVFDYDEIVKTAKPGEYLVHVIALGCDEMYGPNRNGDTFTIDTCRNYHNTFKKHARVYREHAHHDPEKSYGIVKCSAFNEKDGRIELIIALNATKQAAARNKGLVADKEIQKLESGKDMAVSMACKVAYDQCSGCGNKARNRGEYCTESMCKYGGLKSNLGKAFEDGHVLRAFNPEPKFFDISHVGRPADRIAYSVGVVKTASAPWLYPTPTEAEVKNQLNTLATLAFLENSFPTDVKVAAAFQSTNYRITKAASQVKYMEVPESVYTLTKYAMLLPPEDFLILYGDFTEEEAVKVGRAVRTHTPGVFNRLLQQDDILDLVSNNFFYPRPPERITKQASVVLERLQCENSLLYPKATSDTIKLATYNSVERVKDKRIVELADTYGLYQLAALSEWPVAKDVAAKHTILMNRTL